MFALTDQQLAQITNAAALLSVPLRDPFLRSVANRCRQGDDLGTAICVVLSTFGVSAPRPAKENRPNAIFP
jgi:hypothetical protein